MSLINHQPRSFYQSTRKCCQNIPDWWSARRRTWAWASWRSCWARPRRKRGWRSAATGSAAAGTPSSWPPASWGGSSRPIRPRSHLRRTWGARFNMNNFELGLASKIDWDSIFILCHVWTTHLRNLYQSRDSQVKYGVEGGGGIQSKGGCMTSVQCNCGKGVGRGTGRSSINPAILRMSYVYDPPRTAKSPVQTTNDYEEGWCKILTYAQNRFPSSQVCHQVEMRSDWVVWSGMR